jgi:hypothetical protein
MVALREFLYRRDDLVLQFLEQLEGGGYEEEQVTERTQSTSGVGGSIGARGASVSGEHKKQGEREAAYTFRQSPASRFNRLHRILQDEDAIQPLAALDDGIWDQLRSNEVLEIEAHLALAPGVAEISAAGALGAVAPLLDLVRMLPGTMLPDDFDRAEADKISNQLPLMERIAEHFASAPVPCTFTPVGSPRYKFFTELLREHLVVNTSDLEGEATILVKIQRLIPKGKPETVGTGIIGNASLNRQQRRSQDSDQPLTVRLSYPASVVTAIGVYR